MRSFFKVAAALFAMGLFAQAAFAQPKDFRIQAQDAVTALTEFARQANRQILFKSDRIKGIRTNPLKGSYDPSDAIAVLLKDTGLRAWTREGDILVVDLDSSENPAGPRMRETGAASGPDRSIHLTQVDQTAQAPANRDTQTGDKDAEDSSELVVTGSRVRGQKAPVGAQVIIIEREDMERQGLFSAEDVIRSLPYNFSGVNSGSTTTPTGEVPIDAFGQSAANLRGLGTDATLVLVNGRRIAGSPTFQGDGTVNLNTIPAAAIERVEVLLDGASAIYGSDALGGVINFILRKDWQGAETSVRTDAGSNGGDIREISQVVGTNWTSGGVTATLSYQENDPVSARKAGYITQDLRPWGGSDYRVLPTTGFPANFPGNVSEVGFAGPRLGSLPAGWSGPFTQADLSMANVKPYDAAASGASQVSVSQQNTRSVALNAHQSVTDSVSVFTDLLFSKSKTMRLQPAAPLGNLTVPVTNPFNTLGRPVRVDYLIQPEDGIPGTRSYSDMTRWNGNLGLRADLPANWRMELVGTYSEEERESVTSQLLRFSPALQRALAGVDENGNAVPAFNPFTGEHSPGLDVESLIAPSFLDGSAPSEEKGGEFTANGPVFAISGGKVNLAAGAQYRNELIDYTDSPSDQGNWGLDAPGRRPMLERTARVLYAETVVPLIGAQNAMRGARELLFTVAGRWEEYTIYTPVADGTNGKFSAVSPRIGLSWRPVGNLRVRGSWNNSFRAPSLTEMGQPLDELFTDTILDLGHPSGTPQEVDVPVLFGGNLSLKAETVDSISLGFDWQPTLIPGLTISPTYTRMDWNDRIDVASIYTDPDLLLPGSRHSEVARRDAAGNLLSVAILPVNLDSSFHEFLDLDVSRTFDAGFGTIQLGVAGTYTMKAERTSASGGGIESTVGTQAGPDDIVLSARFGWSRPGYGFTLTGHYSSSYENENTGSGIPQRVSSYTTFDLTGYFEGPRRWVVNGGIRNLMDASFPFFDSRSSNYDPSRVDTKGRTLYVQIKKAFDF